MTAVFLDRPYDQSCQATVISVDDRGIRLDATVFYPSGGGQPGDRGVLRWDGNETEVRDTIKGEGPHDIVHIVADDAAMPAVGASVEAIIDWPRRYRHMRMHTALHLLCSVIEGDVTGGQVGADKSRLDFNLPSGALDKERIAAAVNALIAASLETRSVWISDEELAARPDLVRTMSVRPPAGSGRVRLLRIGPEDTPADLQPCGGTHVASTAEIGRVEIGKIENKGKQNRRVTLRLADA